MNQKQRISMKKGSRVALFWKVAYFLNLGIWCYALCSEHSQSREWEKTIPKNIQVVLSLYLLLKKKTKGTFNPGEGGVAGRPFSMLLIRHQIFCPTKRISLRGQIHAAI